MTREELKPGQEVLWWHDRGWWRGWLVPATVVRVGPKRVTIDAKRSERAGGGTKRIYVLPESLRLSSKGGAP